jgi:pimeloyl-ACP methyl ester carboxylesterase
MNGSLRPTLFLHGGPGLSAIPERELYGDKLPICWWDQPRSVVRVAHPFKGLVDAAEEQARRLTQESHEKVDLLAHSFGAVIALYLASRIPEKIASITLLAPTYDLVDVFIRIGQVVAKIADTPEGLQKAVSELIANPGDFSRFWQTALELLAVPRFIETYWSSHAMDKRLWFTELMESQPLFDVAAFEAIVKDYWELPPLPTIRGFTGPVKLIFGDVDPCVEPAKAIQTWSHYFPGATYNTLRSGHFVQLECRPEEWCHNQQ